jgi:hypothetical protein
MRKWVHGPFALNAVSGQTVQSQRTVLVVVHSPAPTPRRPAGCRELRRCRGVVALVANCLAMRLQFEFSQLWYPGLASPAVYAVQPGVGE